eukprot:TRINITY_DN68440_c0_g1_i1.p1 TRINITY_DN68440_c0_g1~~TRINITY_DN68440_c0_g1_i1.p1  ORF type:complete len:213 (+),score=23.23 TRINITY_DN68440_c0_g1_i1:68-706(+)
MVFGFVEKAFDQTVSALRWLCCCLCCWICGGPLFLLFAIMAFARGSVGVGVFCLIIGLLFLCTLICCCMLVFCNPMVRKQAAIAYGKVTGHPIGMSSQQVQPMQQPQPGQPQPVPGYPNDVQNNPQFYGGAQPQYPQPNQDGTYVQQQPYHPPPPAQNPGYAGPYPSAPPGYTQGYPQQYPQQPVQPNYPAYPQANPAYPPGGVYPTQCGPM